MKKSENLDSTVHFGLSYRECSNVLFHLEHSALNYLYDRLGSYRIELRKMKRGEKVLTFKNQEQVKSEIKFCQKEIKRLEDTVIKIRKELGFLCTIDDKDTALDVAKKISLQNPNKSIYLLTKHKSYVVTAYENVYKSLSSVRFSYRLVMTYMNGVNTQSYTGT